MAYATQDQVLNYLQGGQQQQGVDPTASKSMGSSGGSGIVSTGAPSAAPQGTGGSQQWTNIQSYLNANQGANQQRAENVKQQVQGTFGQEKQQFEQKAQEAKSSAEKATEPVRNINQDKASQLISQASSADKGSQGYQQAIDPLKKAVTTQIQPAQAFSYGLGGDTQELGKNLGQGQFSNFLSMFDKKLQGGRDLSTGQRALQNQLDVQNVDLEKARQDLEGQYKGLSSQVESGASEANKYIQDLTSQATKSQADLRKFLEDQGGMSRKQIDDAVAAHNAQIGSDEAEYERYLNQANDAEQSYRDIARNVAYGPGLDYTNRAEWGLGRDQVAALNPYDAQGNLKAFQRIEAGTQADPNQVLANYLNQINEGRLTPEQLKSQSAFVNYWNQAKAMPKYEAGQRADETTVGGKANEDRRRFNTIMDIFGKQGIEDKEDAKLSKLIDQQRWGF